MGHTLVWRLERRPVEGVNVESLKDLIDPRAAGGGGRTRLRRCGTFCDRRVVHPVELYQTYDLLYVESCLSPHVVEGDDDAAGCCMNLHSD